MPVERTCIICRKKEEKKTFFRLCQREEKYYWDKTGKAQARGYYVCPEKECLGRLAKHKKIRMEMQDLYEMGKRSEEHTSELQSRQYLVCRLLLEKKQHTNVDLYHVQSIHQP